MGWATPQYTRGEVDRAGSALVANSLRPSERAKALVVINNWRASHSYPLQTLKMTLLTRAKKIDHNAVIAQRLKRLSSIELKLRRFTGMKFSRMQDIGGCRAVMMTAKHVEKLVKVYQDSIAKNPHDRPEFIEKYDYIKEPKTDGYRSVHLVYRYRTKAPDLKVYNGLRIEIQLRSQLQHAWATAVETVSTFTGQALKSNIGDESWKRFFALMGSALALREDRPTVPGTPGNKVELINELRELVQRLNVEVVLGGWSQAVRTVTAGTSYGQAFLLVLDANAKTVEVTGFRKSELAKASEQYLLVEERYADKPEVQAVLVSVDTLSALQSAYPNYYLDTKAFLEAVRLAVTEEESPAANLNLPFMQPHSKT